MSRYLHFFLLGVSFLLSLYRIGEIPAGISVSEARMGILLSDIFNTTVINPSLIRLPFALLGTVSSYLFYTLILKITGNKVLSFLALALTIISPWLIFESRIYSPGIIIVFLILLLMNLFFKKVNENYYKISKYFLILSALIYLLSVFEFSDASGGQVDLERNITAKKLPAIATKIFSNKFVENYRLKESLLFEQLDFGNYFFIGYPRQRWGREEIPKFYLVLLPFAVYGLTKMKRNTASSLVMAFAGIIILISALNLNDNTYGLPVLFIFTVSAAYGITKTNHRLLLSLGILYLILESLYFFKGYYKGIFESQFSPRRKVYSELSETLSNLTGSEKILLSDRLDNPENFLAFYDPNLTNRIEAGSIEKSAENRDILVGVLPYEASPSELLFKEEGNYPENINLIKELKDDQKKQYIVVFKYK